MYQNTWRTRPTTVGLSRQVGRVLWSLQSLSGPFMSLKQLAEQTGGGIPQPSARRAIGELRRRGYSISLIDGTVTLG